MNLTIGNNSADIMLCEHYSVKKKHKRCYLLIQPYSYKAYCALVFCVNVSNVKQYSLLNTVTRLHNLLCNINMENTNDSICTFCKLVWEYAAQFVSAKEIHLLADMQASQEYYN